MPSYAPYSPSRIKAYHDCPRKFKYHYVDKVGPDFKHAIPLDRGKLLHLLLELHHEDDMMTKFKNHPDFKEIMKRGLITKEHLKELLQSYKAFVDSDLGKKVLSKKIVYTELPISYTKDIKLTQYDDPSAYLRGYIDSVRVIEKKDEDILWIIDWKSGKYQQPEYQQYDQIMYYSIGMFSLMPFDKIAISFIYVDHAKDNTKVIHRKDVERYTAALHNNINKIEADTTWEKNETTLCHWCNFYDLCNAKEISPEEQAKKDQSVELFDLLKDEDIPF